MKTLHVTERRDWRAWLKSHHKTEKEIWLIFHKKHTGKGRLAYDDAVEEAICFGWIDSIVKRRDEQTYVQKFTPRNLNSRWSSLNVDRAKKMIAAGLMTPAGLAKIDPSLLARKADPRPIKRAENFKIPAFILEALAADRPAWDFFQTLAPSYRRLFCGWVASAKKEETRQKRLAEMLATLRSRRKLGLK